MATLVEYNSSLLLSSDPKIREIMDPFIRKVNYILMVSQFIVALFGLFGNMLALIVINKKSLRNTSSAVFITYMALFDSSVLLVHTANLTPIRRIVFLHCLSTYLTDVATFCANWVLVVITLERYIAVSSPLLAKRFCTVHSARISVFTLITIAVIIFTSTFPIIYYRKPRKCAIRQQFELIHRIYQPVIMFMIPDILLLSNFFTIHTLIKRQKNQTEQSGNNGKFEMRISDINSNRKQRQLTIMLVTVSLAFYFFQTPALLVYISEYFPRQNFPIHKLKRAFVISQISVLLLQWHHATNFIFYCLAGQRFRQGTIDTFYQCSVRLKYFYHRYILCNKNYQVPVNSSLIYTATTTTNNHRRSSDLIKQSRIRTSLL